MEIDSKELLDKINKSIGARDVFKNNTEDLVMGLIYAAKEGYNNIISSNDDPIFKDNLANDYIRQYRTILKFIFAYSSMENKTTMDFNTIVDNLTDLFIFFQEKYAETRNYLVQCSLGKRKIDYDLVSIIFNFCTKKSVKNCTSYIFFLSKTSALSLSL